MTIEDEGAPPRRKRLKVVSIAHSAVNRTSGRLRYEHLAASRPDIDLTVVTPARWREYGKAMPLDPHTGPLDLRVLPVRFPSLPVFGWYMHTYPTLRRLLQALRPDVIHLWEEPWSLVARQAIHLRDRLLPEAAVLLETDQNILRGLPQPFEHIRRWSLARTDLLIGRGTESLRVAEAHGYHGPTAIVEYGVASGCFAPQDRAAARASLGVDGFVIGYVGRIVREKGLMDVLDAMAAAKVRTNLLVLGDGPDREAFEQRVAALGLGEQVKLLAPRPPADVAVLMNALDALVLMSRTTRTWKEQFGRVIMEAHACGTPVIGSDSGAIPSVVGPGGWIVPEGDGPALALLLDRLAANPAGVQAAGQAGLAQAGSRFSLDRIADTLADSYVAASAARRTARRPVPGVLYVSAVADFKGGAEVVMRTMLANPLVRPVLAVPEDGPLGQAAQAMGVTVCHYSPTRMMEVHRPLRPGPVFAAAIDTVRCAVRLRRLAARHGCVVMHSNGLKPHVLCALIGLTSRLKTLIHLHDIPYQRAERIVWAALARCVDRVVIVSRPCLPGPTLPSNAEIVRNGIERVHATLPPPARRAGLRLGFVGRFHPNKGLDRLLDWFGAVRQAGLDATLTIRGRPDSGQPGYWDALVARIEREGLDPAVHREGWVTGAATYAGLDVLLVPSQKPDPAPLVVSEAMSAGVIVAAYPTGGIPDMIADGVTGLLVRDGAELVQRLQAFARDPGSMERMREAAYTEMAQSCDMGVFHQRLADIYADMLSGSRARPERRPATKETVDLA